MQEPDIRKILTDYRTIAVVGLSPDPSRPSFEVSHYMQKAGYRIIPVNPACDTVLGERCYRSVTDIPDEVEVVQIFRRSESVPPVVDEAIAKGAKVVWMQLGIKNPEAAAKAEAAGLAVVMDLCMLREHARLRIPPKE
ncbi:CoA-binding protein [Geomonas sp. RF6]|uniref:CoA-binding protein n=1 Tax=Geomonas sp. RF6 TaxID=2897342 RepID=UPI001E424491|nr:CoA-binding protein [Geomonas sp. RF6]UFS69243.1 CoA-binding protein [Geomonas sp. RF6]